LVLLKWSLVIGCKLASLKIGMFHFLICGPDQDPKDKSFITACLGRRPDPRDRIARGDRLLRPRPRMPSMRSAERDPEAQARRNPDRLVIKSESLRPELVIDRASSQSSSCGAKMALRRAWFVWSSCRSSRSATVLSSSGLSHADCFSASELCVVLAVLLMVLTFGLPRGWYPPPKVFSMSHFLLLE